MRQRGCLATSHQAPRRLPCVSAQLVLVPESAHPLAKLYLLTDYRDGEFVRELQAEREWLTIEEVVAVVREDGLYELEVGGFRRYLSVVGDAWGEMPLDAAKLLAKQAAPLIRRIRATQARLDQA